MKRSGRKSWFWRGALILCGLLAVFWIFRAPVLRYLGSLEVNDGPPVMADVAVVLAGDYTGGRALKGAELAFEGFVPVTIMSNSSADYSRTESELAREFAVLHGYPPNLLQTASWRASDTIGEAQQIVNELRRRGIHKAIVVTSLWHTARSARIFHRAAPDLEIHMVGVNDRSWHDGDWWIDREGRKTFALEALKTLVYDLHI